MACRRAAGFPPPCKHMPILDRNSGADTIHRRNPAFRSSGSTETGWSEGCTACLIGHVTSRWTPKPTRGPPERGLQPQSCPRAPGQSPDPPLPTLSHLLGLPPTSL
eukprot:925939-Rhodomonas_salina.1